MAAEEPTTTSDSDRWKGWEASYSRPFVPPHFPVRPVLRSHLMIGHCFSSGANPGDDGSITEKEKAAEEDTWNDQLTTDVIGRTVLVSGHGRGKIRLYRFVVRWIARQVLELPRFSRVHWLTSIHHLSPLRDVRQALEEHGANAVIGGQRLDALVSKDTGVMLLSLAMDPERSIVRPAVDVVIRDAENEGDYDGCSRMCLQRPYLQLRRAAVCRELEPFLIPDLARLCAEYVS